MVIGYHITITSKPGRQEEMHDKCLSRFPCETEYQLLPVSSRVSTATPHNIVYLETAEHHDASNGNIEGYRVT
jgi:hypothetical protein